MDQQQSQSEDSIQVLIRIRPGSEDGAVVYADNQIKLDKHSFAFDRVFSPQAEQDDIFNAVGKKLITHTLEGYNSCIFVYGQTGSGKTFTMMGNSSGLMQRSFVQIFARIDRLANTQCIVTCSYYELYNEQIIDLLDARKEKKSLNIRQDVKRGMFVQNLTEQSALNSQKLLECLNMGMKNRHIGETMMNRESSRSHSIFTISLAIKSDAEGKKYLKTPKLHFVDLAGSERQKMTMATGDRLKEASNINKSLTTLGMVINALASDKAKTHIPYRDSKLTCLLRDSLGGNSKTFIIATISTSILCFQQTLSTLNFANRAKMVKVKALINQQSLSTNLEQYKEEIRKLKQEINRLKSQKRVNFQSSNPTQSVISKNNGQLEHKFQLISHKIQDLKSNMMHSNMQNIIDMLNRAKGDKMIDEAVRVDQNQVQQIEQQGNQLLQYMMSNHDLLKKIHSTMDQYKSLKEQIKSVEFHRRLPLQEIKTPSKFQRDQYQQLLQKRQIHIKELQQRILSLKEANFKKEVQIKEHRRKMLSMENNKQSEEEKVVRLRSDLDELQKKYSEMQLKYQVLTQEYSNTVKNSQQLQLRLKQSKELYVYAEQKYENERFLRTKLQQSSKDANKKYLLHQSQKLQEIQEYKCRILSLEDKLQEGERREQELRSQIDILSETLQFNTKKIKQYNQKLSEQSKSFQQLTFVKIKLHQNLFEITQQLERKRTQFSSVVSQMEIRNKLLQNNLCCLQQQFDKISVQNQKLREQYQLYQQNSKQKIMSLQQQCVTVKQNYQQVCCSFQLLTTQQKRTIFEYDSKVFQLQKNISIARSDYQLEQNNRQLLEDKYKNQKELFMKEHEKLLGESQFLVQQLTQKKESLEEKEKKLLQLENQVHSTKNIVQEHEQLKKTYKEIIKENYKLKGQYISTSSNNLSQTAKNQQLIAKVAFYEEKFRLMSLQYNKLQETAKKLKQKELTLIKKVEFFQENQKLKKIHSSSQTEEIRTQILQALKLQNSELKESLNKMTNFYESRMQSEKKEDYSKKLSLQHFRYELEQKEQKIKKKLESAIKNWDHAKENSCSGMNLQELFDCWQKIESESRKKIESISKGIKRQKKLKIQNDFIVKENIFLKERVDTLERDINLSVLGVPRKLIKTNDEELFQQK